MLFKNGRFARKGEDKRRTQECVSKKTFKIVVVSYSCCCSISSSRMGFPTPLRVWVVLFVNSCRFFVAIFYNNLPFIPFLLCFVAAGIPILFYRVLCSCLSDQNNSFFVTMPDQGGPSLSIVSFLDGSFLSFLNSGDNWRSRRKNNESVQSLGYFNTLMLLVNSFPTDV